MLSQIKYSRKRRETRERIRLLREASAKASKLLDDKHDALIALKQKTAQNTYRDADWINLHKEKLQQDWMELRKKWGEGSRTWNRNDHFVRTGQARGAHLMALLALVHGIEEDQYFTIKTVFQKLANQGESDDDADEDNETVVLEQAEEEEEEKSDDQPQPQPQPREEEIRQAEEKKAQEEIRQAEEKKAQEEGQAQEVIRQEEERKAEEELRRAQEKQAQEEEIRQARERQLQFNEARSREEYERARKAYDRANEKYNEAEQEYDDTEEDVLRDDDRLQEASESGSSRAARAIARDKLRDSREARDKADEDLKKANDDLETANEDLKTTEQEYIRAAQELDLFRKLQAERLQAKKEGQAATTPAAERNWWKWAKRAGKALLLVGVVATVAPAFQQQNPLTEMTSPQGALLKQQPLANMTLPQGAIVSQPPPVQPVQTSTMVWNNAARRIQPNSRRTWMGAEDLIFEEIANLVNDAHFFDRQGQMEARYRTFDKIYQWIDRFAATDVIVRDNSGEVEQFYGRQKMSRRSYYDIRNPRPRRISAYQWINLYDTVSRFRFDNFNATTFKRTPKEKGEIITALQTQLGEMSSIPAQDFRRDLHKPDDLLIMMPPRQEGPEPMGYDTAGNPVPAYRDPFARTFPDGRIPVMPPAEDSVVTIRDSVDSDSVASVPIPSIEEPRVRQFPTSAARNQSHPVSHPQSVNPYRFEQSVEEPHIRQFPTSAVRNQSQSVSHPQSVNPYRFEQYVEDPTPIADNETPTQPFPLVGFSNTKPQSLLVFRIPQDAKRTPMPTEEEIAKQQEFYRKYGPQVPSRSSENAHEVVHIPSTIKPPASVQEIREVLNLPMPPPRSLQFTTSATRNQSQSIHHPQSANPYSLEPTVPKPNILRFPTSAARNQSQPISQPQSVNPYRFDPIVAESHFRQPDNQSLNAEQSRNPNFRHTPPGFDQPTQSLNRTQSRNPDFRETPPGFDRPVQSLNSEQSRNPSFRKTPTGFDRPIQSLNGEQSRNPDFQRAAPQTPATQPTTTTTASTDSLEQTRKELNEVELIANKSFQPINVDELLFPFGKTVGKIKLFTEHYLPRVAEAYLNGVPATGDSEFWMLWDKTETESIAEQVIIDLKAQLAKYAHYMKLRAAIQDSPEFNLLTTKAINKRNAEVRQTIAWINAKTAQTKFELGNLVKMHMYAHRDWTSVASQREMAIGPQVPQYDESIQLENPQFIQPSPLLYGKNTQRGYELYGQERTDAMNKVHSNRMSMLEPVVEQQQANTKQMPRMQQHINTKQMQRMKFCLRSTRDK